MYPCHIGIITTDVPALSLSAYHRCHSAGRVFAVTALCTSVSNHCSIPPVYISHALKNTANKRPGLPLHFLRYATGSIPLYFPVVTCVQQFTGVHLSYSQKPAPANYYEHFRSRPEFFRSFPNTSKDFRRFSENFKKS